MANLGAKLKGMNWKEFFINNCEKMGLGVISLCALLALAKTSWGTYKTEPDEFMKKVTQGKTQFQNGRWPEERKSEFVARDLGDVVSGVLDGIPASTNYQIPTPFYPRIWTPKEPLSEPKYLRFEQLIADGSRVLLQLEADQPAGAAMDVEVARADDAPRTGNATAEDEGVEKPRQPAAGQGIIGGPMPMPVTSLSPSGTPMPGYNPEGGTMAAATNNAKGYRFAAVRAVFPMKEQLAAIRTAMRLESPEQALEFVRFQDFELERQTAVAGANPWAGKWEKVDIKTAIDVLSRAQFDYDLVDQKYRDAVFTMPLPMRVTSDWKRLASHPQIKRLLTDEEAARQEAKNRAAIEVAERMKKMAPAPGGFGSIQHDISGYQRQIQSGDANMMQMYDQANMQYQQELAGGSGMTPPGMQPGMVPPGMANMGGRNPLVQVPDMLLFRYLDFDVVPGNAYRYRVRLVFKNPLFQRDTSELKQPESAAGEFRYSDWSDPTAPIAIEDDMQVFLAKVNPSPNNVANTTAEFDAFQWMTETGSLVKAQFKGDHKRGRGEQIAAYMIDEATGVRNANNKKSGIEADVLKPAQMTYAKEQIEYVTPNIVIDISSQAVINPLDFPDLDLPNKKITTRLDQAVVVNRYGEVVELDNHSQKAAHTRADNQIKTQEENFKDYRQNSAAAANSPMGLEGLIGPMPGAEGAMMPPGMEGGQMKRRSMTKKGGAGMYGSAYGAGGAPGMSAPGMSPPGMRPPGGQPGGGHGGGAAQPGSKAGGQPGGGHGGGK